MKFSDDQISELKRIAPDLCIAEEGGISYIKITNLKLPEYCIPNIVNVLLCPMVKDGYESSLFFPTIITGCPQRNPPHNWNRKNVRILDENWFALSWKTNPGLRLVEMLQIHLSALR